MDADAIWLAVVISSNVGLVGEQDLHFADEDAAEVISALSELGGFDEQNVFHASDAQPDDVTDALSLAVVRSSTLRDAGHSTRLLVYYTGHAGQDGLHLNDQVMPLQALKTASRVVPADERVFAVDACQSGNLFRSKGATLVSVDGAPPDFSPPDDEAWITSSGAEEQAFEVDQRRGSLFSHFFVSGLRGAADADGDSEVTLNELFAFVQHQTTDAAARMGQTQSPRWESGLGDLVLSDLERSPSGLELVGPVSAPLLVIDRYSARVLAEMPVGGGGRLSVPPGRYQLLSVGDDSWRVADLTLHSGHVETVDLSEALADASGVRSKGGLVVRRPWRAGVGAVATLGAAPGQPAGVGAAIRVDRALGRGHDVGVVFTGLSGHLENSQSTVDNRRLDLGLDWSWDVAWRSVRFGPGLRVAGGWLHQAGDRRDDGPWGIWYGQPTDSVDQDFATASGLALARVAVPVGSVELHSTVGAGAGVIFAQTPRTEPLAQATVGLGWSFR